MSKQDEALADLSNGGIPERAEAVRQLGLIGEIDVLDVLLDRALQDKSPGVRLAAASAAADVLARYRIDQRDAFPEERRRELIRKLRGIDPGRNTGLFQVMACAGDPAVVDNLSRGVRDPRVDVRTGALVGLERLIGSGSVNGHPAMERALRSLLGERRLRSDAALGVARLAWRAGLWSLRPEVEALSARVEERWLDPLADLLSDFPAKLGSEHLLGCWAGRGLDCGEQRLGRAPTTWLVVLPSVLLIGTGTTLSVAPWSYGEAGFGCALLGDEPEAVRVLRAWFDGGEGVEVLQIGSRSHGRLSEKALPELLDLISLQAFDTEPLARQLLALLEPDLSERAAGAYARALLVGMAGQRERSLEHFEALGAAKRVRPEVLWHQARLLRDGGDDDSARAFVQRYLDVSKPRSPFRALAEAWLG